MFSEKRNKQEVDFNLITQEFNHIFDDFLAKISKVEIAADNQKFIFEKYSGVIGAFQELRIKLLKRLDYARENSALRREDFFKALREIETLLSKFLEIISSDLSLENGFKTRNQLRGSELISSTIIKEEKNFQGQIDGLLKLVFNFVGDNKHEARAGMSYLKNNQEYALRFDWDENLSKELGQPVVVCDFQTPTLEKVLRGTKEGESHGHHFYLKQLTELVFGGGREPQKSFAALVETFKEFLLQEPGLEERTMDDLLTALKNKFQ